MKKGPAEAGPNVVADEEEDEQEESSSWAAA